MATGTSTHLTSPVPASEDTPKWGKIADQDLRDEFFYRDKKRRITVALEPPFYYNREGELSSTGRKWIFYRDTNGFREGEFDTPQEAMSAADKT